MQHIGRAPVVGGVRPVSHKRYKAVFDKFIPFVRGKGLTTWNQISAQTLVRYAEFLDAQQYAYRTQYLELTTIKQAVAWLIQAKHLPADLRIVLPLDKPEGTDTYCWRSQEVRAMLDWCQQRSELAWLGQVILALSVTGLRIAELSQLRWSDIDFDSSMIRLTDERGSSRRRQKRAARTLKSGRNRSFPIHGDLRSVPEAMARHADGYVFHGPHGGRLKADTVRRILVRNVVAPLAERFPTPEGEIGFCHGRLHSFRHFFCSLCANRGVPQAVVMQWLGHRESKMAAHYYHLHDAEAQRQMERITLSDQESGGL